MFLNNQKVLLFLITLAIVIPSVYLTWQEYSKNEIYEQITLEISYIKKDLLALRRYEKDFLLRLDLTYQQTFNEQLVKMRQHIEKVEKHMNLAQLNTHQFVDIYQEIKMYQNNFNQLIITQKKIGLTPEDGLYGALRDVAHELELKLNKLDSENLKVTMLQLRRSEKDFMLRGEKKYVEEFQQFTHIFQYNLSKLKISPEDQQLLSTLLLSYQQTFVELVESYYIKGKLDSSTGLLKKMHDNARLIESNLKLIFLNLPVGYIRKVSDSWGF